MKATAVALLLAASPRRVTVSNACRGCGRSGQQTDLRPQPGPGCRTDPGDLRPRREGRSAAAPWFSAPQFYAVRGMARDAARHELYVWGQNSLDSPASITVWDAVVGDAPGTESRPSLLLRTLTTENAALAAAVDLAVDPTANEIVVASDSGIAVYDRLATGTVAPLRTLTDVDPDSLHPGSLSVSTESP